MKQILAVSGGVDSMVLFDVFVSGGAGEASVSAGAGAEASRAGELNRAGELVVAHFNHGTRPSADDDQEFVRRVCAERGVIFETRKCLLGEGVSEERARAERYKFFEELAKKYGSAGKPAEILTAHHLDDLVESVAINLIRGTGWRGLTPMQRGLGGGVKIRRPLLDKGWGRAEVLRYAAEHAIPFRFDPTNGEDKYLRNRVRAKLQSLEPSRRAEIYHQVNILYRSQVRLRKECSEIIKELIYITQQYPRSWFTDPEDTAVQLEILRGILSKERISATGPQLENFLEAIRTYAPGKKFNLPGDRLAKIQKTYFVV